MFDALPANPYFYFVHSYVCVPRDEGAIAGITEYGESFCSAVAHGTIWGTQFHPERSGDTGLQLIRNFVRQCAAVAVAPNGGVTASVTEISK
jgi:glutamine amidotransferase